ncbi:Ycf33 family protein [Salix suchowensis]|nr:Ycf33 family protein [Salix suchowensis]
MKTLRSQFHLLGCTNLTHPASNSPAFIPIKAKTQLKHPAYPSRILAKTRNHAATKHEDKPAALLEFTSTKQLLPKSEHSRFVVVGAVSVGIVWFLMAMDDQKALALGPEGPLMEEFWENVRRYGLYALTVSTEPITAVLILLIFGGSFYVLSQVLSVMLGVSEFSYEYSY